MTTDFNKEALGLTDSNLLAEYQATDSVPGDPWVDALDAEIERRGLDV